MGLEAFLIFISTFISMNTNNQGQAIDSGAKETKTETTQQPQEGALGRGGWDRN